MGDIHTTKVIFFQQLLVDVLRVRVGSNRHPFRARLRLRGWLRGRSCGNTSDAGTKKTPQASGNER